ncbi:efflux transporter outer membrane subunit [Variovorax rhizosphaerae]|uniref:Efflux transporter outer membrane subunit n=1 Tax=Variovorax rhizosphaerae TaxID=1836200 RepID=A0ABU8WG49_9BURK
MTAPHSLLIKPVVLALAMLLAGCAVGPTYEKPVMASPDTWKEAAVAEGWVPAAPADAMDRGEWWKLFGDEDLNALAERVQVSNQNIAAAVASYDQAQALVREQRAGLFPTLGLSGNARRSGDRTVPIVAGSAGVSLDAGWTPDIWGNLRAAVNSAQAQAQASAADLAAARLSAIGLLATSYFSLREADAELILLDDTIEGYQRSYTIARNRYEAGIAPQSDVLQAQTQLVNARAERVALKRTRDTLEHAIAVLVGAAPAQFQLAALTAWKPVVPSVPLGIPSTLLQRRPDIASAERAVEAANAQIGIARSAYFPSLTISASAGTTSVRWQDLFSAPQLVWSFGLAASQVLFDAGAIGARVDAAKAAHEGSVARYRQTVLTAFQNVEDQLTATASLAQQEALRREASVAADKTEQQFLNRYRAGQVSYTDVVTAQASALSARRTVLQLQVSRQAAAVGLIQGLGGGWDAEWLRGDGEAVSTR